MSERHDYDAIWRDQGPMIWRAVFAYTGGRREMTDDALAEAFARAIQRGDAVRDPVAYLYRVAFRIAAGDLRESARRAELEDGATEDPEPVADLMRALRRLSPAQRAAVFLHYRADLPVKEVAWIMGTSTAAVKVHLMRGRRRLAALLGDPPEVDA